MFTKPLTITTFIPKKTSRLVHPGDAYTKWFLQTKKTATATHIFPGVLWLGTTTTPKHLKLKKPRGGELHHWLTAQPLRHSLRRAAPAPFVAVRGQRRKGRRSWAQRRRLARHGLRSSAPAWKLRPEVLHWDFQMDYWNCIHGTGIFTYT